MTKWPLEARIDTALERRDFDQAVSLRMRQMDRCLPLDTPDDVREELAWRTLGFVGTMSQAEIAVRCRFIYSLRRQWSAVA